MLSFSERLKAFRHGASVGRAGQFKRDQAFRVAVMLGYQESGLAAFIQGFRRVMRRREAQ